MTCNQLPTAGMQPLQPLQPLHLLLPLQKKLVANRDIDQHFAILPHARDKLQATIDYLTQQPRGSRVIVFCATKRGCDNLSYELNSGGGIRCVWFGAAGILREGL